MKNRKIGNPFLLNKANDDRRVINCLPSSRKTKYTLNKPGVGIAKLCYDSAIPPSFVAV